MHAARPTMHIRRQTTMPQPLTLTLSINGQVQSVSVADDTEPLLYVLRNQLGQNGPKYGCGVGYCGACAVLVNGVLTRSCVTELNTLPAGAAVQTLDALGTPEHLHPLQQAFLDEQAGQCAYCLNGMLMGALAWLHARFQAGNHAVPSPDEVKQFLSGQEHNATEVYLCRCGAHLRIIRAICRAAQEMRPCPTGITPPRRCAPLRRSGAWASGSALNE